MGDTKLLLDIIEKLGCTRSVFQKINGPFAFIYINKKASKLYFARDKFGRRSLLIGKNDDKLLITSVAAKNTDIPTIELPALGIFCINLSDSFNSLSLYPWESDNQNFEERLQILQNFLSVEIKIQNAVTHGTVLYEEPSFEISSILEKIEKLQMDETFKVMFEQDRWKNNVLKLHEILEQTVSKRIDNQPKYCINCISEKTTCNHALIGILFSGGLDCSIITLIADKFIDQNRPIDLLNVSFEKNNSYDSPDRITARQTLQELQKLRPNRMWNLVEINVTNEELCRERESRIVDLIYPLQSILDDSLGCALWFASRGKTDKYITPCRVSTVNLYQILTEPVFKIN